MENNLKFKQSKAFTLIELLVVIALIGILAGIIVVSMSGSQESARDARIKNEMDQLRRAVEVYGLINQDYEGVSSDGEVSKLLSSITSQGGSPTLSVSANGSTFCITSSLNSTNDSWCVDHNGYSGLGGCTNYQCNYTGTGSPSWSCGSSFTDSRDGNTYSTVQIGTQCWMAENLAYLPSVVGSGTGSETTPYYYVYGYQGTNVYDAKATSNYTTHGVLYNYPAAMSACPYGWKLPTDTEWNVLEQYVVDQIASLNPQYPCSTSETGWRRCADSTGTDQGANGVGQALKESGLGSGVGLGTNLVGFSSKLSGRLYTAGSFGNMGADTYFWSSTGSGSSARHRYLNTSYSTVARPTLSKAVGFSVRCLLE